MVGCSDSQQPAQSNKSVPASTDETVKPQLPKVKLSTNHGDIIIQLRPDKAPITVKNFIEYLNAGFYANTQFHRVIKGFMIQGGGFDLNLNQKPTHDPIENEANNGLANLRGTIAMARRNQPNSATSQFFINLVNNPQLNYPNYGGGYAVFGRVIKGMEVVDAIANVEVAPKGPHQHVPIEPVVLLEATLITQE